MKEKSEKREELIREVRDESGDMVMPKRKEKEFKKGGEGEN